MKNKTREEETQGKKEFLTRGIHSDSDINNHLAVRLHERTQASKITKQNKVSLALPEHKEQTFIIFKHLAIFWKKIGGGEVTLRTVKN